ncbi:MAG: hypothetical protein GWN61_15055, partial [candidate division Zixibacteria bacterium]|nr:hypothetical protein [candidate division Zixibacteria bacterium]NIR65555.1 hypothetical protein [candidate division Zixibacteria bacterium]NIS47243.1 hypothetical protein [candidate division Zixibacteria bacterium]NIU15382.1 hypothetical protein [candidate division Zixibacteria bacterium]NIV07451.1 hypothetical protein [candidate division Zixibacteria bacterium]
MSSDVADLVVHVTTGPEAVADIQRAVFAGGPPSGPASGDLADSYPAPSVVGIRGRDIADVAPADLSFLGWDAANTRWSPMELPISYGDSDELTGGLNTGLHYHDSDRARANHTGEQAISTVTGLQSALDGKQDSLTFDTVPTDAST